ncbi:MAG: RNA polymerase sigma factor [Mangrovibacterium sp.]
MMGRGKNISWSVQWRNFRKGDMDSFHHIYDHFFDRLFQYGCKIIDDTELVEDSIQELFLTLYTNRNHLSDTGNLEFYLLKALKLTVYGKLRKERRRIIKSDPLEEFNLEFLIETEETESIEQRKVELVLKSLKELSPAAREIIYLKFYSDLSYEEIGHMLGIKADSAKKQVYRIVSSLRVILKDVMSHLLVIFHRTGLV